MERNKIFVVNFFAREMAETLTNILEGEFELQLSVGNAFPPRQPARVRAELVIICLGGAARDRGRAIVEETRMAVREARIVVATEPHSPQKLRELLECSPDDFITPPFRAVD